MESSKIYAIADALKSKKGTFLKLVYERPVAPSAKFKGINITKHVEVVCRAGVKYSHMAAVIDRRAEKSPNPYVKTWEWVPGYENFIKKNIKSGQLYMTFATAVNGHKTVTYTIDGVEEPIEAVKEITPPSYWSKHEKPDVFDVKFENIIKIGGDSNER